MQGQQGQGQGHGQQHKQQAGQQQPEHDGPAFHDSEFPMLGSGGGTRCASCPGSARSSSRSDTGGTGTVCTLVQAFPILLPIRQYIRQPVHIRNTDQRFCGGMTIDTA